MNYIPKKQNQTEVLRKTTQPKNKPQTNRKAQPSRDSIDQNLLQQLRRRQTVIEKMYKRSVANKLYIYPRMKQDLHDVSINSNESIEEMDDIQTYKLGSQNHQSNTTVKNSINYFSESVVSNNNGDSKTKIDLAKFRTKFSSNKKLIDPNKEKIINSIRSNPQKLLIKGSIQKKRQDQSSLSSNKQDKSKRYTSVYQQILSKIGIKVEREPKQKSTSTSSMIKKGNFTYRKAKAETTSEDSIKDRYKMSKQPACNISVSKILQKYKSSGRRKEDKDRCKTQY